jgi:hypothetical protein
MVHGERHAVVDVHHAILPTVGRLQPSSARLFEQSRMVESDVRVPAPVHMILHAAAHLFHDGEIAGAVRDLVDLDRLLREFEGEPDFWPSLVTEAPALQLTRPLFYAVRYARRMFETPVPEVALQAMAAWGPAAPVRVVMDRLVDATIAGPIGPSSSAAAFLLYVRSHWLRMQVRLLVTHLILKSLSPTPPAEADA